MKTIVLLALLFLLLSCTSDKSPLAPDATAGIRLFLLQDTKMRLEEAQASDIDSLALQAEPWLSSSDILIYDYSTHFMYLKGDAKEYLNRIANPDDLGLMPFVFMAKEQRIFVGAVYLTSMAYVPPCPAINSYEPFIDFVPKDVFLLTNPYFPAQESNILNDARIKDALMASSIFHAGVSVKLDSVLVVENSDTATVRYSFTVKNNDQDNLYAPDPDLMGSELFHYYSGGLTFWHQDGSATWARFLPDYMSDTPGGWQPSWFVKIARHTEIKRTVTLRGYPRLAKGSCTCDLHFGGKFKIEANRRRLADGRYWLGHVQSARIPVDVTD